jgi:hypothetical protein
MEIDMAQGRFFDETEIQRIVSLLASTEMSIAEIATRMSCSRGAVVAINRKRQVRNYEGHRTSWRIFHTPRVEADSEMTSICAEGAIRAE